jgi:alginate O-acetyltransferase complex protein AlgI
MDFNSISYFIFLPIVFFVYWLVLVKHRQVRNVFILSVSYFFYASWDWRFLSLIAGSTILDFFIAKKLSKSTLEIKRKLLLFSSLILNLGVLGVFKYYNFFASELVELFSLMHLSLGDLTLNVVLPVGISFYTFQTLSYTIDVYKRKLEPSNDIVKFAAYVGFFPQLVAGPIERAGTLLPQFDKVFTFNTNQAINGFRLIVWGLFKKVVIADSLAPIVNEIFANYSDQTGVDLALGAVFFAFQIYGDFSGYSDIAIGSAKLFGFELMSNFKFPYFSRNVGEFWRRWHISLSTWFRDYLYIPLGGSRVENWLKIRNVFMVFLISGLWHGANWTFIIWGGIHAVMFIPSFFSRNKQLPKELEILSFIDLLRVFGTFSIVCIGWVFFRADNISHAISYFASFTWSFHSTVYLYLVYPLILLFAEWQIRNDERLSEPLISKKYEFLLLGVLMFVVYIFRDTPIEFIYFQF